MSVQIAHDHLYAMTVATVRYALGRQTYVVSETSDIVKSYAGQLSNQQRNIIKRDIEVFLNGREHESGDLIETWRDLHSWLVSLPKAS